MHLRTWKLGKGLVLAALMLVPFVEFTSGSGGSGLTVGPKVELRGNELYWLPMNSIVIASLGKHISDSCWTSGRALMATPELLMHNFCLYIKHPQAIYGAKEQLMIYIYNKQLFSAMKQSHD